MKASLRSLLSGVIDYAGLFPPASLSLDSSIRNYAHYLRSEDAWMLGRFICPAARLAELVPYVEELFASVQPLPISVLGRGANTVQESVIALTKDSDDVATFRSTVGRSASTTVYETRAPRNPKEITAPAKALFLEPARVDQWQDLLNSIPPGTAGFKLRTGGVDAAAFPPAELIASVIVACRERNIPLKFTAGLHHPIRHFDSSVQTKMHGFINVFVAGVVGFARRLDEAQLTKILLDEDAGSFQISDDDLGWQDLRTSTGEVEAIRNDRLISFGSCSFDEPRADLRDLGWL